MKIITCPEQIGCVPSSSVFLAGGIVGCSDWQSEMTGHLAATDLTLLNPRRPSFPIHDPSAAPEQIQWEFQALRAATLASFWFDEGIAGQSPSPQPIVMFEYGWWLNEFCRQPEDCPLVVGCHPNYIRRLDVEWQTRLVAEKYSWKIEIASSLEELAGQIKEVFDLI